MYYLLSLPHLVMFAALGAVLIGGLKLGWFSPHD
jgi:hypothetical protein